MAFKKGVLGKKRNYYSPLPKKCCCKPSSAHSGLFCLTTNTLICLDFKIFKLNKISFKKHLFGIGTTLCSEFSPSPEKHCSQTCHSTPDSNHKLITFNMQYLILIPSDMTSVCPELKALQLCHLLHHLYLCLYKNNKHTVNNWWYLAHKQTETASKCSS